MRMVASAGSASSVDTGSGRLLPSLRTAPCSGSRRPSGLWIAVAGRCVRWALGITLAAAIVVGVSASAQVASAPQPQAPSPQQRAPAPQQQAPAPQQPAPQQPAPQQPAPQQPAAPQQSAPPVVPAPAVLPAPVGARTFTAPTGVIFNVVRPERVVDFELVIGYLQAALEKSANAKIREQARGWRMFKSAEPGPNGTVLYVFLMDPAAPGADYALGPILSDAFPDQIEQIWKLYQGSLAGGGSLLNLTPVKPPPLPPPGTPPTSTPTPEVRPGPPPPVPDAGPGSPAPPGPRAPPPGPSTGQIKN